MVEARRGREALQSGALRWSVYPSRFTDGHPRGVRNGSLENQSPADVCDRRGFGELRGRDSGLSRTRNVPRSPLLRPRAGERPRPPAASRGLTPAGGGRNADALGRKDRSPPPTRPFFPSTLPSLTVERDGDSFEEMHCQEVRHTGWLAAVRCLHAQLLPEVGRGSLFGRCSPGQIGRRHSVPSRIMRRSRSSC